jgi:hypothetical protein
LAPWPGGWWRLADIVELELDLTWAILRWAVQHDQDLLFNFWQMNRDAVVRGGSEAPYGFAFSPIQFDSGSAARLTELLRAGGVELSFVPGPIEIEGRSYPAGAHLVSAAQPFRPFILEMLDSPPYPMIGEGTDGEPIRPYDVTAWHLPSLLGVEVQRLVQSESLPLLASSAGESPQLAPAPAARFSLSARDNASYRVVNELLVRGATVKRVVRAQSNLRAGDFLIEHGDQNAAAESLRAAGARGVPLECDECWEQGEPHSAVRIGLYSPWGGSMDEGWTRLLLDRYGFAHERLRPEDFRDKRKGDGAKLAERLPVLIFPSVSAKELREGEQGEEASLHEPRWPDRYQGGLSGAEVQDRLLEYLRAGGRIVALDASTDWLIDELRLPVRVELQDLDRTKFYAPGTLVRAQLDLEHRLTWGSPGELAVYFAAGRAFRPLPWAEPTAVIARYAEQEPRVAGFLVGEREMAGRPCWIEIPVGSGRVILFGFSPQHRAQTEATFKLLFASILADN